MQWILDDGPFDLLADVSTRFDECDLGGFSGGGLLISSAAARQADRSSARQRLLELARPDGQSLVKVFEVLLGGADPAGGVLQDLHKEERTSTNLAEREAIAWALVHGKDAVFVTSDKRALLTALAELGRGRVAHPFDLWVDLRERGVLQPAHFQFLCERTKEKDQGLERMPERVSAYFDSP